MEKKENNLQHLPTPNQIYLNSLTATDATTAMLRKKDSINHIQLISSEKLARYLGTDGSFFLKLNFYSTDSDRDRETL